MEQQDSLFTQADNERLEQSYQFRKQIVDFAFAEGRVPNSAKDIEAINSVLSAMDKSIYDKLNVKLKHQENQSREAILDMVSEALRTVAIQKANLTHQAPVLELQDELTPTEFVPGELEINPAPISLDEIMKGEHHG